MELDNYVQHRFSLSDYELALLPSCTISLNVLEPIDADGYYNQPIDGQFTNCPLLKLSESSSSTVGSGGSADKAPRNICMTCKAIINLEENYYL